MAVPFQDTQTLGPEDTEAHRSRPVSPVVSEKAEKTTPHSSGSSDIAADTEKAATTPQEQPSPRDVHGIKWVLAVISVLASTFLFALDNTIVADIQPAIIQRFGEVSKLPWLSVAFLVAAAGTNLVWGKIYGQFDAKFLYLFSVFLFEAGSAICGAANTMDVLIFGRALCGLGGVAMYAGVMTLLSVCTSEHERPMYIGLTGVTWGLGTVLGPIIGGAFVESSVGWRFGFYLNLFVGAACAPAWFFFLPRFDPRPGVPIMQRFKELDYVGTVLICGAYICGVFAIGFGGILYPWSSGRVIALFVLSGVLFITFGVQQGLCLLTTKERRIFPVEFLYSRTMITLFMCIAAAASATFIPIYFVPLFYQFARNATAISAGVHLLPYVACLVVACVANGAIMSATGYYMPWYLFGGILTVIGNALLYTVDTSTSDAKIYGYTVLAGIGAGAFIQASFSVAQAKVSLQQIPIAIGYITCGQVGGATISLAISNAVFLNGGVSDIKGILPNESEKNIQNALAGASAAFFKDLDEATRESVINAIVSNIKFVYALAITAGALVTVLSIFMKREKLFMKGGAAG